MTRDTLSDLLRAVRLRGAVFYYVSNREDWAAQAPPAHEIAAAVMPGAEHVMEFHLVAKGRKSTVDSRVLEVMHRKMKLIEAVIGRRLKGEQDIGAMIPVENDISDLFDLLSQDAREVA